jgi:serine/threonine protein kinase
MSGLEPGFVIGHYRITRSLGSGGMADVYEAHDENLERIVALKILPIEYCRNPQLVQRFQKEVRAAAKLNHRNIVTVFEVGQHENYHFFSMRLLTGGDLRSRIEQGLTPIESLAILREVADAFAHAHARGFVHRDVKPENIMFDEQGFPVLTDFGIAKALDANTHMTRTGMTMGTPRYLSPEQASGKPVDARADLYSLGIILHEMLTGRPPYDAEESMAVIFKHVTEPIPVLPQDFARYQPLLEKLMAKDPNQRFGSAAELIQAIDAIVPRTATGELKQSQQRTSENPLVQQLMTPSPLRTPAPKTPAPKTPAPVAARPSSVPTVPTPLPGPRDESGEVAVQPRVTTREPGRPAAPPRRPAAAPPAQPSVALPPLRPSPPPAPAPVQSRKLVYAAIALVSGLAVGAPVWFLTKAQRPESAATATPPPPQAGAAEADTKARKAQDQAAAQQRAEEQAALKAAAEERARREAAAQARLKAEAEARQRAELEAKQRAAQAEARRRAEAEAEARRSAEAEAAARRRADADAAARRQADAEAAAKSQREAEAAARARREEEQRQAATAAATAAAGNARVTIVNDCGKVVDVEYVGKDKRIYGLGTLKAGAERSWDSFQTAKWRIHDVPRRKAALLKEFTVTASVRVKACAK